MDLSLRQIEVFRAVISTGSISGASKVLHVSQPAVSRLLAYTEDRIGFPLFERIKGRLYATPEARRLFREVDQVYLGVQRVNEVVSSLADRRQGIVHIVASPSIGHMLIPLAIARLRQREPEARVTFQCLHFEPARERLLRQQADIGVLSTMVEHPNLECVPVGQSRLMLICPPGHRLAGRALVNPAEIPPAELIGYPAATPFAQACAALLDRGETPARPMMEVASPQSACALVEAGAGIALVDEFSLHNWRGGAFVIKPVAGAPRMTANLAYLRFEPLHQLARGFAAALRDLMVEQGFSDGLAPPAASLPSLGASPLREAMRLT